MNTSAKIPFYAKVGLIFLSLFFFFFTLYLGKQILLPLTFSILIAILLNPLVNYLLDRKINKIFSIVIVVVLVIIVIIGIFCIISSQLIVLKGTFPELKVRFNIEYGDFANWLSYKLNIPKAKITAYLNNSENKMLDNYFAEELSKAGRIMMQIVLLPVYIYLILFYKPLLLDFILKLFRSQHHIAVAEVLINTKRIIQNYLIGLFIEMVIVALLNSLGLLVLGIDYAIILGIVGAIINIIPYIGGIVAIVLPMIIALITKDSMTSAILVFLVYTFIQFVDNHYIIPKIVASRVKINALIAILVVLVGNAVWGVPGMFLSIPLTAIIKVIFDHVNPLKPWGFLLGNNIPSTSQFSFIRKNNTTL